MRIYIVEDDLSVINILEDIIETQGLGEICGDCGGEPANLSDVLRVMVISTVLSAIGALIPLS